MGEHTPGPWSIGPTEGIGQRGRLYVVDTYGGRVADCESAKIDSRRYARPLSEDEANARLMAAAPELLAALSELSAYLALEYPDADENISLFLDNAQIAIDRATNGGAS